MKYLELIKMWFKTTKFKNLGLLIGVIVSLWFGFPFIAGGFSGFFLSLNWVELKLVYKELKEKLKKEE